MSSPGRTREVTPPTSLVIYEPLLYFALQGKKRRLLRRADMFEHGPGSFLIASVDAPVVCGVVEASAARPYAGVAIALDVACGRGAARGHAARPADARHRRESKPSPCTRPRPRWRTRSFACCGS